MRSEVVSQYRANCAPSRSYLLSGMNTLIGCSATAGELKEDERGRVKDNGSGQDLKSILCAGTLSPGSMSTGRGCFWAALSKFAMIVGASCLRSVTGRALVK